MQSILKFKYTIVLLFALNCVLLCAAQGGNGGWGGGSGGNGGWEGSSGGNGAPGASGGGSGRGAPGAPGGGYYDQHGHSVSAAANIGLTHLKFVMILMPFTFLLKYVCNK